MMARLPFDLGTIHFTGIGGIGMSGIAEILHNLGHPVQGSDIAANANVRRLQGLGIDVALGHDAENIGDAAVVVVSTAIRGDNPEIAAARARLTPVVRRAEMLGELMRLKWGIAVGGTHGKTTTTSLVAALMDAAGMDPTVVNGGIINAYGTNARLGDGDWMIVEADESDGSFLKLPATIAIVTNIDPEHLDHYGDFDALRFAFESFVGNIPFYGCAVLCLDDPEVQAMIPHLSDRRIITYGLSPQADVRGANLRHQADRTVFDVEIKQRIRGRQASFGNVALPMLGEHNVRNALAALAVGWELGLDEKTICEALAGFKGVNRRFTRTGVANGITVIDDYGHHPVEIAHVLKAARAACRGRVIAVAQPHRYSRLNDLFEDFCSCFNDADKVLIADVYPAGEDPIPGADRDSLVDGLRNRGHRNVRALESADDLPGVIADIAGAGDFVICLGAGNITAWAHALPGRLEALNGDAR